MKLRSRVVFCMAHQGGGVDRAVRAFFIACAVSAILTHGFSHAQEWKELKGDHFIVSYVSDEEFAEEILRNAERHYQEIASDLGYQRYSDFWTWEKRVKIILYPDKESFLKATNQMKWSEGMADYLTKRIISYQGSARFIESILPHEMAHLIFRDYVGFTGEVPLWIDEGVAQWMEREKRPLVFGASRELLGGSRQIPIKRLTELDIREVKEQGQVTAFYLEAVSLVGFLIEQYGSDRFVAFCRQLRDGKSLNEALRFAYPTAIRSVNDLEAGWKRFIGIAD